MPTKIILFGFSKAISWAAGRKNYLRSTELKIYSMIKYQSQIVTEVENVLCRLKLFVMW